MKNSITTKALRTFTYVATVFTIILLISARLINLENAVGQSTTVIKGYEICDSSVTESSS